VEAHICIPAAQEVEIRRIEVASLGKELARPHFNTKAGHGVGTPVIPATFSG
jgi:hypothetical protein